MDSILSFNRNEEVDFYNVLGCDRTSNSDQIQREFKIKALSLHPDKNVDDPEAEIKFKQLMRAKEVLLDEKRRNIYDKWLDSGVAMSFEKWENMQNVRCSMHWVNRRHQQPMIESKNKSEVGFVWERDSSLTLDDFRNYRI